MRTDQEMLSIILKYAVDDKRIRVVTIEGSRLNENIYKDKFQDFDISFIVTDIESYKDNDNWLDVFGKRVIMQKPEAMAMFPSTLGNWYSYIILFEDGNKMDLKLIPLHELEKYFNESDSLTKILIDKDKICPVLNNPSDIDFRVKKPSPEFIDDCCNEFWLLLIYTIKGLYRDELLYAIKHLDLMREQMLTMISWKIGIDNAFSLNIGKAYKYLNKYVSKDLWASITKTFRNDSIDETWNSLILCCTIFHEMTIFVSNALGYHCPQYEEKITEYIKEYISLKK
ncbi:MAG: aminoglycoside 6-adenylyltransferase [Treponema sp.]|jgi:aminoglycoside 6-adenylyltransferase|nr:aminoglycoside 6-adenylyltransferase [Treponema sp.]